MDKIDVREVILEITKKYIALLEKRIKLEQAYLYGSYAKGTSTTDSDIDIAVVSDEFSGDLVEDQLLLMRMRREIDNRIEPHPFKSDEFVSTHPYVSEILKSGIRVK